jgi:hypothetical protein
MWRDFNTVGEMIQQTVTGASGVKLTAPSAALNGKTPERVILQTPTTNNDSIFVKNASNVAANGSTGGYEMPPGATLILPLVDNTVWYVIVAAGSQKLQVNYLAG